MNARQRMSHIVVPKISSDLDIRRSVWEKSFQLEDCRSQMWRAEGLMTDLILDSWTEAKMILMRGHLN